MIGRQWRRTESVLMTTNIVREQKCINHGIVSMWLHILFYLFYEQDHEKNTKHCSLEKEPVKNDLQL